MEFTKVNRFKNTARFVAGFYLFLCVVLVHTNAFARSFGQMTNTDAEKYCANIGKRLPTIKELAIALRPECVSDVERPGFRSIRVWNKSNGNYSYFYYRGLVRSTPQARFWSSSYGWYFTAATRWTFLTNEGPIQLFNESNGNWQCWRGDLPGGRGNCLAEVLCVD